MTPMMLMLMPPMSMILDSLRLRDIVVVIVRRVPVPPRLPAVSVAILLPVPIPVPIAIVVALLPLVDVLLVSVSAVVPVAPTAGFVFLRLFRLRLGLFLSTLVFETFAFCRYVSRLRRLDGEVRPRGIGWSR